MVSIEFRTDLETEPVLGVCVWTDAVELDYRMGHEWGPAQVTGFFELLGVVVPSTQVPSSSPTRSEGPPYPDRFLRAWDSFRLSRCTVEK